MILPGLLKCKLFVCRYGGYLMMAFLILGLIGAGVAGWLYTHPTTEEVTIETNEQTISTTVKTSAIVKHNTSLWQRGTKLTDMPAYPMPVAPNMTIRVNTTVPSGHGVDVKQEVQLIYVASSDTQTFWRSEHIVVNETLVTRQGKARTDGTIHVPKVSQKLNDINNDLQGVGSVSARLRVRVQYKTNRYSGTLTKTVPLKIKNSGYKLAGDLQTSKTHSSTRTELRQQRPDLSILLWLMGLGIGGLFGAGLIGYIRFYGPEPGTVERQIEEARFRGWISVGTVRYDIEGEYIEIDSLSDLVDIAIDSNNRVIYDSERDIYAVIDGGEVVYYFTPGEGSGIVEIEWQSISDPSVDEASPPINTNEEDGEDENVASSKSESDARPETESNVEWFN